MGKHVSDSSSNTMVIINKTKDSAIVSTTAVLANSFRTRLCGLLGRRGLAEDAGLLLRPSSGVHTFGMKFAIDIVCLDKNDRVIEVWPEVEPWKVRGMNLRVRSVLELASGRILRCGIAVGDQLVISRRP